MSNTDKKTLRDKILKMVEQYGDIKDVTDISTENQKSIPPSGKVIGGRELKMMTDAVLDGWLTTGRFNDEFEKKISSYIGVRHALTTNSGSSANLLAISALTSPRLKERALLPGDEVITVAAGFPTTVNPILQNNCIPVFVDVDLSTYNIKSELLEEAYSSKTKAIVIAHTLGNPFNLKAVIAFAKKYNLWLIEDCCDALGAEYQKKKVGSFGDLSTFSFYPAHQITMGEGGAVLTDNGKLKLIVESIRDWGRDCFCPPGSDNTCKKRFNHQLGELPDGYDHKYIYSHMGYNLKITDIQAACGLAQLESIDKFVSIRRKNFNYLLTGLKDLDNFLVLPKAESDSNPSWFGFPITISNKNITDRLTLVKHLNQNKIGTRLLFSGNIIKQPYFQGRNYRIVQNLSNTDTIMNNTFWIGVYPGISTKDLDYVIKKLKSFFIG